MSFTDQKPRIATERDVKMGWNGRRDNFRCYLCGHRFAVGDYWRWVWSKAGNFLVCAACDGDGIGTVAKYMALREEWKGLRHGKFWHFVEQIVRQIDATP